MSLSACFAPRVSADAALCSARCLRRTLGLLPILALFLVCCRSADAIAAAELKSETEAREALRAASASGAAHAHVAERAEFRSAFQDGDFAKAEAIARRVAADDHSWLVDVGAAAAAGGRPSSAADAFCRAEAHGCFLEKDHLYLRARALVDVHAFARARQLFAEITQRWPHSRLAAADERVRQAIDRRLTEPVTAGNLAWCGHQQLLAMAAGHLGLACEYGEELRLLSAAAQQRVPDDALYALAESWRQIGSPARGSAAASALPDGYREGRGALLKGMLAMLCGRDDEARDFLLRAEASSQAAVAQPAMTLLGALSATAATATP